MADLLIRNGLLLGASSGAERADIVVDKGRIVSVGPVGSLGGFRREIDASNHAVMPGFVNCHGHGAMTLLRGIGDDLPLQQWLEEEMWPREERLDGEAVYWGTMLAIAEMLKGGTTTFTDMYFFMDDVARAVEETGIRAVLSRGMIGTDEDKGSSRMEESKEFVSRWHGAAGGRISAMLGPHAPYTCSQGYLSRVADLSAQLAVPVQIHISETSYEVETSLAQHGKTPVGMVRDSGLMDRPLIAAHCVDLRQGDIDILAEKGVTVAHNPGSNLKLGSGIAPVPQLLDKGVVVGLGTDGAASNNNLDMMEEMRLAALIHKGFNRQPTLMPVETAFCMATENGGRALFLEDVGRLEPGCRADIVLLSLNRPHLTPGHNILSHVVYAAQPADVDTVIVDGRVLVEKGRLVEMDEEKIIAEAERCARRICGEKND